MLKAIQKLLIFTMILIGLSGCTHKPIDYSSEASKLSSEQVIEYYVNAWNEKNFGKMNIVLSDEMKARTFNYDSVKSAKIVLSEPVSVNELPDTIKDLSEVTVYKLELEIKGNNNAGLQDEKTTANYYVGKEKIDSPWLIYNISEVN